MLGSPVLAGLDIRCSYDIMSRRKIELGYRHPRDTIGGACVEVAAHANYYAIDVRMSSSHLS